MLVALLVINIPPQLFSRIRFFKASTSTTLMAVWRELPLEILEKILVSSSDADLVYRIANVSCTLNSLALKEYFRRFAVVGAECVAVDNTNTRLALRALRSALWIKKVSALTVRLNTSPSIFREIHDLSWFIRQLDSLCTLNLYILGHVYTPSFMSPRIERAKLGNLWWRCFGAVLGATLSKGVEGVCVFESAPDMLDKYIGMDHEPPILGYEKFRNWVAKRRNKFLSYIREAGEDHGHLPDPLKDPVLHLLERDTEINACGNPSVQSLHLPRMLLSPLLFRDTLAVLSVHSHTIHTVNLHEVVMDPTYWKRFFETLRLPLLEQFTFTGPPTFVAAETLIPVDFLLSFLRRHPKVTHLQLQNILRESILQSVFKYEPPSLPKLRALTAHAALAGYLLEPWGNCKHLEFLCLSCLSPHSPSTVRPVGVCTPHFDMALTVVTSEISQPLKLELELETAADIIPWMSEDENSRPPEYLYMLTHVHDVEIFLGGNTTINTNFLANVFPKWLGSFSALHRLHIHIHINIKKKHILSSAILALCPHLLTLMINYEVIPSAPVHSEDLKACYNRPFPRVSSTT